jgi:4-hydroxymandelate oxidase
MLTDGTPHEFATLQRRAAEFISPAAMDFVMAGAGDERSIRDDAEAWDSLRLRPRVLTGLSEVDTSCLILGDRAASPILVAPTGGHRLVHPEGEAATAAGAANAGAVMVLSAYSNVSMEAVAAAAHGSPLWFQLPHERNPGELECLMARAADTGYRAVVLTVDQVVMGWSPTGRRHVHELPRDLVLANLPGEPAFVTGYHPDRDTLRPVAQSIEDLAWLVERSPLPVVVKGVLHEDDAIRCADVGVRGVVVSNHGGRHLDGTISPACALPRVVDAVGDQVEVYADGGIRRGDQVLKALALGATAVLVGRAPLLGLACSGADGVRGVLDQLREELLRAMALCGVPRIAAVDRKLLA